MSLAFLARAGLALALVAASPHTVFSARVSKVVDGDTIRVQVGRGDPLKVRLIEIDAPEPNQPYGREARQALAGLVGGREVRLETHGTDGYGRLLARVFADEIDVNAELIRRGAAWVYRRYSEDPSLLSLERDAREQRRGLWALPSAERIPPWQFRHPDASTESVAPPSKAAAFRCGEKKLCREMESCAEARFHLAQCGLSRLDGDGDGVPCEALCAR